MTTPSVDALNTVMNFVTLAGVVGLVAWGVRWVRSQRAVHRELIREIARLRMAERDTTELSRSIAEIRRAVTERDGYAQGFLDAIGGERPPPTGGPFRVVR